MPSCSGRPRPSMCRRTACTKSVQGIEAEAEPIDKAGIVAQQAKPAEQSAARMLLDKTVRQGVESLLQTPVRRLERAEVIAERGGAARRALRQRLEDVEVWASVRRDLVGPLRAVDDRPVGLRERAQRVFQPGQIGPARGVVHDRVAGAARPAKGGRLEDRHRPAARLDGVEQAVQRPRGAPGRAGAARAAARRRGRDRRPGPGRRPGSPRRTSPARRPA